MHRPWQSLWPHGAAALALWLSGCSPALDWREVRAPGDHLVVLFPCKPASQQRAVPLADRPWQATLQVCEAQGLTFALLSLVQAGEVQTDAKPAHEAELEALIQSAPGRWGLADADAKAPDGVRLPAGVVGRWSHHTRAVNDAPPVRTQALFLNHQGRLYQLSVSGPALTHAVFESFFGALKLSS